MRRVWGSRTTAARTAALRAEKGRLRFFTDTSWNVKARQAMIRTAGLVKRYGSFTAVDGIDLNIPRGEIYGFLGPNGAGKTSTIMMLLGITQPTAGEIWLFGEKYVPRAAAGPARKRIGVVPEKHPRGVWPWMTAREYLALFADLFAVPRPSERIEMLLEKVELARFGKEVPGVLPGHAAEAQHLRALLPDPDILFLDEPISGLDPMGIKQVRDLIVSENREGRTIFISSHQLSEMEKICHRVAIIFGGKLLVEDTMGDPLRASRWSGRSTSSSTASPGPGRANQGAALREGGDRARLDARGEAVARKGISARPSPSHSSARASFPWASRRRCLPWRRRS